MDTARYLCPLCPLAQLLATMATMLANKVVIITGHNHLHNLVADFCHRAHLGGRVESDSGLTPGQAKVMDVLVLNWERGP